MNIHQRLLKIASEARAIPKNGYNSYSNYAYIRAVDVVEEISKLLVNNGVDVLINELEFKREFHGKNFHSIIKSEATFYNVDDPKDFVKTSFYSVSADTLDKDIFKAKTNGLKYLYTQKFNIVTADLIDTEEERGASNQVQNNKNQNSTPTNKKTFDKPSQEIEGLRNDIWSVFNLLCKQHGISSDKTTRSNYMKKTWDLTFGELYKLDEANLKDLLLWAQQK